METTIILKEVSKKFGRHEVLKNVNLKIKKGGIVGLVGQSGSGKTTLIRVIMGIYKQDCGQILNLGSYQEIGFASQEYSFYPRLTVEENLRFYGRMYSLMNLQSRIDELLQTMELTKARHTRSERLSGGMKRRLDIALSIIHSPKLLILDEPTTGLDIVLKDRIWALIEKIRKMGITILISSHDLLELEEHCDEIAFIRKGVVFESETLKKYKKKSSLTQLFKKWYVE